MKKMLMAVVLVAGMVTAQAQTAKLASAQPLDLRIGSTLAGDSTPAGAAVAQPAPQLASQVRDYRIGSSDLLEVEVYDVENLKRTVRVSSAGTVTLPLVGQVRVAGLTAEQAEQHIADLYREKYLQNPQVSLLIKEYTTERITVEGAVQKPGIYPLAGQMTLLRVLALAGGFGPIADSSQVMLYRIDDRKVRQVAVFDVEEIRAGKADDPVIRGDDLIVVQRDSVRRMLKDSVFRDIVDSINPFSVFSR